MVGPSVDGLNSLSLPLVSSIKSMMTVRDKRECSPAVFTGISDSEETCEAVLNPHPYLT